MCRTTVRPYFGTCAMHPFSRECLPLSQRHAVVTPGAARHRKGLPSQKSANPRVRVRVRDRVRVRLRRGWRNPVLTYLMPRTTDPSRISPSCRIWLKDWSVVNWWLSLRRILFYRDASQRKDVSTLLRLPFSRSFPTCFLYATAVKCHHWAYLTYPPRLIRSIIPSYSLPLEFVAVFSTGANPLYEPFTDCELRWWWVGSVTRFVRHPTKKCIRTYSILYLRYCADVTNIAERHGVTAHSLASFPKVPKT